MPLAKYLQYLKWRPFSKCSYLCYLQLLHFFLSKELQRNICAFQFDLGSQESFYVLLDFLFLLMQWIPHSTQEHSKQISDRKYKVEFLQICCLNAKLLISASSASLSLYSQVQFRSTPVQSENLLLHSVAYSILLFMRPSPSN